MSLSKEEQIRQILAKMDQEPESEQKYTTDLLTVLKNNFPLMPSGTLTVLTRDKFQELVKPKKKEVTK